jgi:hypothetical protein
VTSESMDVQSRCQAFRSRVKVPNKMLPQPSVTHFAARRASNKVLHVSQLEREPSLEIVYGSPNQGAMRLTEALLTRGQNGGGSLDVL